MHFLAPFSSKSKSSPASSVDSLPQSHKSSIRSSSSSLLSPVSEVKRFVKGIRRRVSSLRHHDHDQASSKPSERDSLVSSGSGGLPYLIPSRSFSHTPSRSRLSVVETAPEGANEKSSTLIHRDSAPSIASQISINVETQKCSTQSDRDSGEAGEMQKLDLPQENGKLNHGDPSSTGQISSIKLISDEDELTNASSVLTPQSTEIASVPLTWIVQTTTPSNPILLTPVVLVHPTEIHINPPLYTGFTVLPISWVAYPVY
ncbi:hypothetical protein K474DRAFT_1712802 [Panus rudis PR-1116 ss-1]|nr:hypothetical protein K474DRAFT_1712802 [Panus rudis PR-1116 ss-1]